MSSDADLAAIRAFVAGGGQFQTDKDGNIVAPIQTPDDAVEIDTPAASAAPAAAQKAPSAADQARAQAIANRDADRQADRQARLARQQQADQQKQQQQAREKSPLVRFSNALTEWASNVPTPGGNLALVLILIFFAFAIIPVNAGKTRLQLIWLVLTGNAELPANVPGATGNTGAPTAQAISDAGSAFGTGVLAGIGAVTGLPIPGAPSAPSGGGSGGGADPSLFGGFDPLALLESPR